MRRPSRPTEIPLPEFVRGLVAIFLGSALGFALAWVALGSAFSLRLGGLVAMFFVGGLYNALGWLGIGTASQPRKS